VVNIDFHRFLACLAYPVKALPVFTAENVPVEASSAPEIVPDRFVIFQRLELSKDSFPKDEDEHFA
jgi:hypothetical protein